MPAEYFRPPPIKPLTPEELKLRRPGLDAMIREMRGFDPDLPADINPILIPHEDAHICTYSR